MRVRWRRVGSSRCGALVVSLALIGALPHLESIAPREHRCACHHAPGERCTCSACRRASLERRRAELGDLPPCHRAAAAEALDREQRAPPAGVPVVLGCCDTPEQVAAALQVQDPYLPAPAAPLAWMTVSARIFPATLGAPRDAPSAPPTPPPRRA